MHPQAFTKANGLAYVPAPLLPEGQDLAASQQRARRYRLERDQARTHTQTLANACRALDEENDSLRTALSDTRIITALPSRTGHNDQRTRPPPG